VERRKFITFLGSAAAAWPLAAHAQPTPGRPLVGLLTPGSAIAVARNIEVLRAALRALGYVEGRNIWLEFRHADGVQARLPALAAELVARKPDVIIAAASQGVVAVHDATRTIPVVMNSLVDPVALGVVKSIARPGGNVTGIWLFGGNDALIGKRIGLLKEIVPNLSRIGVMAASGDRSDEIA
jgi:putative ABC transport system substrate-binding protein